MNFLKRLRSTTIAETCSCGSSFTATGSFATSAALQWRMDHGLCRAAAAAREGATRKV